MSTIDLFTVLEEEPKDRYSDEDLNEFRCIVEAMLTEVRTNGVGKFPATDEERKAKFIKHLEDALLRIRNKTYGICRVTGKLISKERLRAVPHATICIDRP
jgi:hypothetical protein